MVKQENIWIQMENKEFYGKITKLLLQELMIHLFQAMLHSIPSVSDYGNHSLSMSLILCHSTAVNIKKHYKVDKKQNI